MNPSRRASTGREGGFTLIEVLVAMTLTGIILAAVSAALIVVLRTPPKTVDHLGSSDSAFRTSSLFADDIASAIPEAGEFAVARNTLGCGREVSVLRIVTTAGSDIEIRSYTVIESGQLERRVCRGGTRDESLDAPIVSARTVVTNLVADTPPTVTCRATAGSPAAPETHEGDLQCRLVSMTVTTSGSLVFTVDGRRETVQTPLTSPIPTVPQCTMLIGADTFVDSGHPEANNTGGRSMIKVMSRWDRHYFSLLKFDLLAGCEGENEPTFLPGGKTLKSATLRLTLIREDRPVGDHSNRQFQLTVLPKDGLPWHEDHTSWSQVLLCEQVPDFKFPCPTDPLDPDVFQRFEVPGSLGSQVNVNVTGAVNKWYTGALHNRGWVLDRDFVPSGEKDKDGQNYGGWWFGSRDNTDSSVHPKLILKWD